MFLASSLFSVNDALFALFSIPSRILRRGTDETNEMLETYFFSFYCTWFLGVGASKSLSYGLVVTAVGRYACYLVFCKVFWFFDTTSGAADIEIGGDTYNSVWSCFFFPPRSMAWLLLNIHGGSVSCLWCLAAYLWCYHGVRTGVAMLLCVCFLLASSFDSQIWESINGDFVEAMRL